MRSTGIPIIGDVPWGTHFCQFYQDQQDLVDILVPYFKAGLENNEFCMWVTSEPLRAEEAKTALASEVKNLDGYLRNGQIEILDCSQWYTAGGGFDSDRVLQGWVEKLELAKRRGFEGLRLTGNTLWLEQSDWQDFTEYEAKVDGVIGQYPMLAICTYSLARCGAVEIMDVVSNHAFALIKRAGQWQMIENAERKRIEEVVLKSERRMNKTQEIAHLGSWELDLLNNRLSWSDEVYRIFGLQLQEFGATYEAFLEAVHPDDRAAVDAAYSFSLREGKDTYEIEHRVVRRSNGEIRIVHEKCEHIRDGSGRIIRSVGMVHDITERRRAEEARRESEERYRSLFDNMAEGFALHDIITDEAGRPCDYRFLDINPSFERLTGLNRPDVVGRRVLEVLPGIEPQWIETYGRVALDGRSVNFEKYYPAPLNRWYEIFAYRPAARRFAVIFVDITARKQAEAERARLLDSERAARSEAERANRIKDEFLANLSHELRTPLNPILGWTQILQRRPGDEKTVRQGLDIIERNARAQTQLISDLLDMSRIISGKLRLDVENCDLASVLETAVESIASGAEAKSIRIEKIIDPSAGPVLGDAARLQQVFSNILSNAVKFTPSPGKVRIILRRINSHVEVIISDTGQGINPDFLPYLFERFRQADSSAAKRYGGLGLGLAIVKHLVELHGGTVTAESPGEGQGSTFTVSLPIMALRSRTAEDFGDADAGRNAMTYESVKLAGIKLLMVDDEGDSRDVVGRLLQERGAEVRAASSASEALDVIQQYRPDVLIADIGMPEMDGYELIRRVRGLPPEAGGETPAVALTAYSRAEDRTQTLLAGYQYHLAKPVEISELIATLAMMTGRVRRAQATQSSG